MKSSRLLVPVLLLAIFAGCSSDLPPPVDQDDSVSSSTDSVDVALRQSRIEDAQRIARNELLKSPHDPDLLTNAARATAAGGDHHGAADLLVKAAIAASFEPTSRVELAVSGLLELGKVYPAMDLLARALNAESDKPKLRRVLFGLFGEAGRTDLMQEHYEAIIRDRSFDIAVLLAFTDTSQRSFPPETIDALIKRNPNDHRLRLGIAQSLRDERRFTDAEAVLREIIRHHSDFAPALALLGRMPSVQQATNQEYAKWLSAAVPYCRDQADFWIAVGDRNLQSSNYSVALSCHLAAAQINPNKVVAWTQMASSIRQMLLSTNQQKDLGEPELSKVVAEQTILLCDRRAKNLLDLRTNMQRFGGSNENSQQAAADVARTLSELGRFWEAEAWSAIATTLPDEKDPELNELRQSIIAKLSQNRDWSLLPDLSALSAFDKHRDLDFNQIASVEPSERRRTIRGSASELILVDETRLRSVTVPKASYPDIAASLIQTLGTGGGTVDFDLDGQPDLVFLTSGGGNESGSSLCTLLRNLDGCFNDATTAAQFGNTGFGQSVAMGDYNQDGFQDIFFANIGANRLLRNNGDGTYSDATMSLGTQARQWTTGGAFADMDGDGITDLIAINYCDLDSAVHQPCQTSTGPAPCHPARFPADRDQLLLGDANGGFSEKWTNQQKQISPGRSLGILAGSLSAGSPSAMIANDMSANHLLQVNSDGLQEMAVPSGIAVDGQSLAQASMGIASGDFDGDLDLDFYVTGFAREYNIYYEQRSPGLWVDSTAVQGLIEPTLMTVGFGTQAIDLDADGTDELAITNGHIGEFGPNQPPLSQRFQLLRRSETGTFELFDPAKQSSYPAKQSSYPAKQNLYPAKQSSYLANSHIGRALWKVDVDGDLADDMIVTHQNAPPVLLANRSDTTNRRIGLQCIGTTSARDAIGTTIHFNVNGRQRAIWVLSGDGYMSNNDRVLKAGIGSSDQVQDVTVTWPTGSVESFGTITAGSKCLLIEGTGESFSLD
ncbi:MAG: FG-GAP-like repeat-containing protein [Pirellulaceae bacterium]